VCALWSKHHSIIHKIKLWFTIWHCNAQHTALQMHVSMKCVCALWCKAPLFKSQDQAVVHCKALQCPTHSSSNACQHEVCVRCGAKHHSIINKIKLWFTIWHCIAQHTALQMHVSMKCVCVRCGAKHHSLNHKIKLWFTIWHCNAQHTALQMHVSMRCVCIVVQSTSL